MYGKKKLALIGTEIFGISDNGCWPLLKSHKIGKKTQMAGSAGV